MLRAFFLAVGLYCVILGLECLVIDKAVLANGADGGFGGQSTFREVSPAEWAPWSLMSGGAVVILYSFTIPRKMKG